MIDPTVPVTPNKGYALPPLNYTGPSGSDWGTYVNAFLTSIVDLNLGGRYQANVAGNSDFTVSSDNAQNLYHSLSGAITGNIRYVLPNKGGAYLIYNGTTGSYTVTAAPAGGSGASLPAGQTCLVFVNPDTNTASVFPLDLTLLTQGTATNVFNYIPSSLLPAIIAKTSTTDVTTYLNAAHAAAGVGGRVYYPAGKYICSQVQYLDQQAVVGAGPEATVLSKIQAGKEGDSILVFYNWYNNITTVGSQGLIIMNMGFAADYTSTGGTALVIGSDRARVLNCDIIVTPNVGNYGAFGGIHCSTNTRNGTMMNGTVNGVRILDNVITGCTKGAIFGFASYITAINANVSITLSRSTSGSGGINSYTDTDSNVVFTGTSNGTTTILVSNTTGLNQYDEVIGPDIISDSVADVYVTHNVIRQSGSTDGAIAAIDQQKLSGWNISMNKIESCPGVMLNCQRKCHSLVLGFNTFDYVCNNPVVGTNYCVNLFADTLGNNIVIGNVFKSRNIVDTTKTYVIVNWQPDNPTNPSEGNIFAMNSFDVENPIPTSFVAFNITDTSLVKGVAWGNSYWHQMSAVQRGNGDAAWAGSLTPGAAPPTPPIGWTMPYVDSADSNKLKVKYQDGTTVILAAIGNYPGPVTGGTLNLGNAYRYVPLALTGNVTINPPGSPYDGQEYFIKDTNGGCASHTATFTGTLDGAANRVINTAYGWFNMRYDSNAAAWYQK